MRNTYRSIIDTIIKQDVSRPEDESDVRLAVYMLVLFYWMAVLVVLMMVICCLGVDIVLSNVVFVFIVSILHIVIWKRRSLLLVDLFAVIIALDVAFMVSTDNPSGSLIIWAFVYPVFIYTFADLKRGIFHMLFLFVLLLFIQAYARLSESVYFTEYSIAHLLRFSSIYLISTISLVTFIWVRSLTRARLDRYSKDIATTIEELEQARIELKKLGNIDHLTTLYNKRYLESSGNRFLKNGHANYLVSIFIDIDNFKLYNDHYGHIKGDMVLTQVSRVIKSVVKNYNSFLVRFGGEEIVCLLKIDDFTQIETITANLIGKVEELGIPHICSPFKKITISAGVSWSHQNEYSSLNQLIHGSDDAMYHAKKNGKNQYFVVSG